MPRKNIIAALALVTIMSAPIPCLAAEALRTLPATAGQLQLSFAPLVKKVAPAVVNIYTRRTVQARPSPFANDPFYSQLLESGLFHQRVENSLGSGVIVKSSGLIVTNNHVIKDSDEVIVVLADKREFQAKVLIADQKTDLALLAIDTHGEAFPYLQLTDSDKIEVGDLVLAIGNPFGIGQTVTSGIVSDPARTSVGIGDYPFFIQTDAAINPGNSGGALVDMEGRLVGVNTAIFSTTGAYNGIGFAIPSNMVRTIITSGSGQEKKHRIIRPWFGAIGQNVTPEIASVLKLKTPQGVLLDTIYPGGPASEAGLKQGDVVIKLGQHDITDGPTLRFHIATYPIGEVAPLKLIRDGKELTVSLAMQPPSEIPARDARRLKGEQPLAGAQMVNLSPAVADELDFAKIKGVVVWDVAAGSAAERMGLVRGDIIESLNGIEVTSSKQLAELVEKPLPLWEIVVRRGNDALRLLVRK